MAATVKASGGAPVGPSTVPHVTPESAVAEPGWTKRAMRTMAQITGPGRRPVAPHPSVIIETVTSPLSGIAVEKRRQLAATLGLFAMLFIAVGAVAATGADTGVIQAFVVIALLAAIVLALMAWGVLHSVKLDLADRKLDAAIEAAVVASGRQMCDCGHEHDPDELHFVDGEGQHVTGRSAATACAHDGTGAECSHSCDTCVLAALRPASTAAGAPRRPMPGPGRPSPAPRR
jgi:hypothetical protein